MLGNGPTGSRRVFSFVAPSCPNTLVTEFGHDLKCFHSLRKAHHKINGCSVAIPMQKFQPMHLCFCPRWWKRARSHIKNNLIFLLSTIRAKSLRYPSHPESKDCHDGVSKTMGTFRESNPGMCHCCLGSNPAGTEDGRTASPAPRRSIHRPMLEKSVQCQHQ